MFGSIVIYGVAVVFLLVVIESVLCDDDTTNLLQGRNNTLDFASQIINSQNAEDGRYSYAQVSLQYRSSSASGAYLHQCGGSIIAPDIILTAAHCQYLVDRIYIDVYDVTTDTQNAVSYTFKNILAHPQYEKVTFRYDFAIIHLTELVDNIVPIRLNNVTSIPTVTDNLVVIGWGATQPATTTTGAIYPNLLQKGYVQAITNANCEATVIDDQALYEGEIFDEMLCAEGQGVDACSGDSGGPLVVESVSDEFDLLVGSVSWGRGCAVYPGVYSRISAGYDWIRSQVCYRSADPPSYMECQLDERNPVYVGGTLPPTVSPITKPPILFAPVTPVNAPTSAATVTAAPIPPPTTTLAPIIPTTPAPIPTTAAPATKSPTPSPTIPPFVPPPHPQRPSISPHVVTMPVVAFPVAPWNTTRAGSGSDQQQQQTTASVETTSSAGTSRRRRRRWISHPHLWLPVLAWGSMLWSVVR